MIYCGDLKNNGEIYHAFYDRSTKKLRFYLNGHEVENDYLYNIYNKPKYCLRGYDRLKVLLMSLSIITASISVTALSNDINFDEIFPHHTNESIFGQSDFELLSGEELYNEMLSRNPEMEEYLEMTKDVVLKYGEYMNQEELLNTIGDLKIVKTSDKEEISSGYALAFYTKDENKIYLDSELNVEYMIRTCLFHEILHYYSQSGLYDYNIYSDGYTGYALNEGMTEMLNAEFTDNELFTYHKEAAYVGALCEIVGPEVFLEAYFGNDVETLIDALAEYSSQEEAEALIKTIDLAKDSYDAFVYYESDEDYDNFVSANIRVWDMIGEMYENKYSLDINNDNLMMAYKTATTLQNYCGVDLTGDNSEFLVDVIVNKHYFVKPDAGFVIVDYSYADENGIIGNSFTIDDRDRYLENNAKKNKF